jgi:anti-sigma regulatory factor (Ser/Thr protein kinase)
MPGTGGCPPAAAAAAAFDDLPEPVWELHGDELRVVTANRAARAAAADQVVVVGGPFAGAAPGLDTDELLDALRRVLRTGEPVRDLGWTHPESAYVIDADQVMAMDGTVRGVLARARAAGAVRPVLRVLEGGAGAPDPAQLPAHMPDRVPIVSGARLAAHHVGAPAGSGQWFDVVALPPGRVALATGNVGQQPTAAAEATAASTLRAVLADCLLAGGGLLDALARLDATAARIPQLRGATVAVAVLDTATGVVEHARCGHLPAVFCGPGATGSLEGLLTEGAGGPLGVDARRPVARTDRLQPGGMLLLHARDGGSDPGPVTAWLRTLLRAATELWPPLDPTGQSDSPTATDVFTARLIDRLGGPDAVPGLTLLTATRPRHPHADLRLDVPAEATELAAVRATLTAWLEDLGATAETATAVPLVVSELVSNVVEHAYPPGRPGPVRVRATVDSAAGLLVSVADDGGWAAGRLRPGYGLAVARELSQSLTVHPSAEGTLVEARFPLGRAVVDHPFGRAPLRTAVPGAFEVSEREGSPPVVVVRGPVDLPVVDDLRSVLLYTSGGGTRPIVLDLSAATGVAAAGVRLLYELSRFSDPLPRVIAPAGSTAHDVLTLAGLARLLAGPG